MSNKVLDKSFTAPVLRRNVLRIMAACRDVAAHLQEYGSIDHVEAVLFSIAYAETGGEWYILPEDLLLVPGNAGELGPWQIRWDYAIDAGTRFDTLYNQAWSVSRYLCFYDADYPKSRAEVVETAGAFHHYGRTAMNNEGRRAQLMSDEREEWNQYRERLALGLTVWESLNNA